VEKDGFQFFAKDFEMESGGNKTIAATLEPLKVAAVAPSANTVAGPANRANEKWHDWIAEQLQTGKPRKELLVDKDGYRIAASAGGAAVQLGPALRDQAVRLTFRLPKSGSFLQFNVRYNGSKPGNYRVQALGDGYFFQSYGTSEDDTGTLFYNGAFPKSILPNQDRSMELRAVGDEISVFINGELVRACPTATRSSALSTRLSSNALSGWTSTPAHQARRTRPIPPGRTSRGTRPPSRHG